MSVKLLTEHHLQFLSLKKSSQARLSLHLSKYHIVGNHMSWLICVIERSTTMTLLLNLDVSNPVLGLKYIDEFK